MRVGIIGAGAAGLTTAWLLNDGHAVTLFEKQNRLGGHADTVLVDRDGEQIPVDVGFEFFSDHMFPTFRNLLQLLDVALCRYPATATFYTTDHRQMLILPPFRNGRIRWSMFKPSPMFMIQVRALIQVEASSARRGAIPRRRFYTTLRGGDSVHQGELRHPARRRVDNGVGLF